MTREAVDAENILVDSLQFLKHLLRNGELLQSQSHVTSVRQSRLTPPGYSWQVRLSLEFRPVLQQETEPLDHTTQLGLPDNEPPQHAVLATIDESRKLHRKAIDHPYGYGSRSLRIGETQSSLRPDMFSHDLIELFDRALDSLLRVRRDEQLNQT